ncbi:MAG: molybdopterin-dependent oxidoreductase [Coriobacteriales bacterium]|jgi:anaerobic dimethyl sulfoxide reductase subunit A|nr:molybdopterin-dependent oxidoreductase [Coriobacteriales bacterium]
MEKSRAGTQGIDRRSFLAWGAVLGGSAALAGGFVGCAPSEDGSADGPAGGTTPSAALPVEEGEWKSALCRNMSGCGSSCANFALVKDGVVTRMKTDDRYEDSRENPQRRGCHRGMAHRQRVYGEERLKYPMKRKSWNPGGTEHNGHLRGIDEWERISWDEALELTASELKRIIENYGNSAIYAQNQVLSHVGGATDLFGTTSTGDSILAIKLFQGDIAKNPGNDRFLSPKNTKLMVLWGQNTAFTSATTRFYFTQLLKQDSGAKVYSIAPDYNNSAVALGATWVPVRPGTDCALFLAVAYHMIENDLQDQDFLDRCCIGFDADHMPEGAPAEDNFKDYVLGIHDGTPKTPEWASEICGTDPALIRELATDLATIKPCFFHINGRAPWRTSNGRCSGHAAYVVGWMSGNVGIEGGGVNEGPTQSGSLGGDGGGWLYAGQSPDPRILNPIFPKTAVWGGYGYDDPFDETITAIAYSDTWNAILKKERVAPSRGKVPIDIRCVLNICNISLGNNFINTTMGTVQAIEAYRSLEFVVCHDLSLSAKSKYADIVFPDTFAWEEEGYVLPMGDPNVIYLQEQIIEPPYECQTVRYLERELARKLGVDPDVVHPYSDKQLFFDQVAGSIYLSPEAQGMVPLVTITQEDIDSYGVEGTPQEGIVGFDEIREQGGYVLHREPGDFYEQVSQAATNAAFREDPENNPLSTQSGKLEIYCSELKRIFEAFMFETDVKCIPYYRKTLHSYEDSFTDWENKVKGPYPIQIVTPHSIRGTHSCLNDVPWLRKAHPREFVMNRLDAEARGLKTGDTVLISSLYGKILRNVAVTDSVMPGVAQVWHGSWNDFDEDGIDRGGCSNTLIGANTMGYGSQPYNSTLVEVEKWTGDPLPADYTWPARVPLKDEE